MQNNTLKKTGGEQAIFDWAYDVHFSHTLWLRRSLLALIVVTVLLALSIITNLSLFPLKEKVPYLYAFDHATGEVTKVGTLEPTTLSANWELVRFLVFHYVINREGYDFNHLEFPYQMVWAQSSEEVRKQYEDVVKSSSPNSPYRLYGKDKYITVRVIAISRLNENTLDVKFEKKLHDRASGTTQITQKEAILKWAFSEAETTQKMLDRDPLGFKVIYYQTNPINLENTNETKGE